MLIYNETPFLSWFYGVPILLAIQFVMLYGLSLIIASINLFFRDLERLIVIFLTFLFYVTPILYPASMIPQKYVHLIIYNPVAPLMISWRDLLMNGTLDMNYIGISLLYSLVMLIIGQIIYKKLSWKFAEVL